MFRDAIRALNCSTSATAISRHMPQSDDTPIILGRSDCEEFLKAGNAEGKLEKDLVFGHHVHHNFELVNRKVIVPSEEEIVRNPRARSAKLRIARKKD